MKKNGYRISFKEKNLMTGQIQTKSIDKEISLRQ